MTYKLHREVVEGRVTRLSLGVAEVDAYLKFLQYRCRYSHKRSTQFIVNKTSSIINTNRLECIFYTFHCGSKILI